MSEAAAIYLPESREWIRPEIEHAWLWAMVAQAAMMWILEYSDPEYFDRLYLDPSMPEWPLPPDD